MDTGYWSQFTGLSDSETERLLREKKALYKAAEERQRALMRQDSPPFQLAMKSPDRSSLRAHELTERECLERALGGDADACIVMAWRRACSGGPMFLSWNRKRDVSYWLDKAEKLGKPGAKFLRHFIDMSQQEGRKLVRKDTPDSFGYSIKESPDCSVLPGYDEFMQGLRAGDSLIYRCMRGVRFCYFLPRDEENILRRALQQNARTGDVKAMEDLCALEFGEIGYNTIKRGLPDEMRCLFWSQKIKLLPDGMQEDCRRWLIKLGLLDVMGTVSIRNVRLAAEYAFQGARLGSRACMFYWMESGFLNDNYLSRADWEDAYRYARILLEESYIPFVSKSRDFFLSRWEDGGFLTCFYKQQDLILAKVQANNTMKDRGGRGNEFSSDSAKISSGEYGKQWDDLTDWFGADRVLMMVEQRINFDTMPPELLTAFLLKLRERMASGDPHSALLLGLLHEKKQLPCFDLEQAWKCYQFALDHMDPTELMIVTFKDGDDYMAAMRPEMVRMRMLDMLVNYPEFPGRDPALAPKLIQDLEPLNKEGTWGFLNDLFGRVYENGIGVPVDQEKAAKYKM